MPTNPNARSKYWCFTLNNPEDIWKDCVQAKEFLERRLPCPIKYCTWQIERGEQTNTPHVQGYIELSRHLRLIQISRALVRAHLELRRGTAQQAIDYCNKAETRIHGPFYFGEKPVVKITLKKEMELIKEKIKAGVDLQTIAEDHFVLWCRYKNAINDYHAKQQPQRSEKSRLVICYGPTGSGKSHYCFTKHSGAYWKQRGDWWDNYDYNETVIIDDFYGWFKYDFLLRLTDRYPMQVPIKGSHQIFVAKTIIMTSNQLPHKWYPNIKDPSAFFRRIDSFIYFPDKDQPYEEMSIQEAGRKFNFPTNSEEFRARLEQTAFVFPSEC